MFQALLTSTQSCLITTRLSAARLSAAVLALGIVTLTAVPTQAKTVLLQDYETTGADLEGASVMASFLNGRQELLTWRAQPTLGSEVGGVAADAWSLTQAGNSFTKSWTLDVGPSLTLTNLVIDLVGGNAVFDVEPDSRSEKNTLGSQQGNAFRLKHQAAHIAPLPTARYSAPVDISQGDLFTRLTLQWESGISNQRLEFFSDTDSGTLNNPVTVATQVVKPVIEAPAAPIDETMVADKTQEKASVPEPGVLLGLMAIAGWSRKLRANDPTSP